MAEINRRRPFSLISGLLIAVFMLPLCSFSDPVARYGGDFMADGGGARALALGGANTSLSSDAWSIFWNPAGLMQVTRPEVGLMHNERFDGVVDYDAASIALPQPDGSVLAAGFLRLGVNGIDLTEKEFPGQPLSTTNRVMVRKTVNAGDYAFFIAKSSMYRQWSWGIAPKLIFRHVGSEIRGYGIGVDAGIRGRPMPDIPVNAAVAVRDVFSTLLAWEKRDQQSKGAREIIPSTVRFGISSTFNLALLEARITPTADLVYRFEFLGDSDAASLHAGLEYLVRDTFALRVGSDDERITFGGGISLLPASIDYAFVGHDELGDTHRISVTVRWGRPL